ncbi:MAG TPA: cation diffusion facilitator family transporter [Accumulibacter sp.]|nr:cation diffusion facilitator family transporter [Accumulibacter sp.]
MESPPVDVRQQNYKEAQKVTKVGTIADVLLTLAKLLIGFMSHSAALVAEGLHSAADVLFDLVVMIGMHLGRKEADDDHPYGHGKFESLATLLLAFILLGVAVGIALDAANRIKDPDLAPPEHLALWVAAGSMVVKEMLYRYTVGVGRRIGSNIIVANAWHHRSDSIASFAALLGIAGAIAGWPMLDPVAAIGVAYFVGKVGVEIATDSLKELTDSASAVVNEIRATITRLINEHPEVLSAHLVKARKLGPDILVDVHVVVDTFLSVTEGHQIADQVEKTLLREVTDITAVMVHVDTRDELADGEVAIYPNRRRLRERFDKHATLASPLVELLEVVPHYTADGVVAEVFVDAQANAGMAEVRESAMRLARQLHQSHEEVKKVRIHAFLGEDLGSPASQDRA